MKKLLLKRHYKVLVLFFAIVLLGLVFGQTRIISYNFGEYFTEIDIEGNNYDNTIILFDETLLHNVEIDITDEQYEYLINSYINNGEKEYISVDVKIDGELIENVGLRLKGDIDIVSLLESGADVTPSFLIKFDKYEEGVTYQSYTEIAIQRGNLESIILKSISQNILEYVGIIASNNVISTGTIGTGEQEYITISEVVDSEFIIANIDNEENGIVYKASNSLSFSYIGEDPTDYLSFFEQETKENNYDLKKLISLIEFTDNSLEEDFLETWGDYYDTQNILEYFAIKDLLGNKNISLGLLDSYYIYIDTVSGRASIIPREISISFGDEIGSTNNILARDFSKKELKKIEENDVIDIIEKFILGDESDKKVLKNELRKQIFENDEIVSEYEDIYNNYQEQIFNDNYVYELFDSYNTIIEDLENNDQILFKTTLDNIKLSFTQNY